MKLERVPWNARRLKCGRKRRLIRKILHTWKDDVVCLQETKLTGDTTKILKEVWTDQWRKILIYLWRTKWVRPGNIKGLLKCWNKDGNAAKEEGRWKIVLVCTSWIMWKERNRRCFEDKQSNFQKFKMNCLALFYFWCKQKLIAQTEDIFDALDYS
ncbi:hypothetical protein H5410_037479 [Solanum commersonii]|uniref:Uncharacterized protein n=1 Tax=Solanum commersonii TaxID=4109 RepID=A0A9J5Y8K6_SOLCO|nr:hypothetical protein H5410_037479 [Solanum commersonii]